MPSGSRSVGGTCTTPNLPLAGIDDFGIAPVMSLALIGEAVCGIVSCALSSRFGADVLFDCLPIGVGDVSDGIAGSGTDGAGMSGATPESGGDCARACSSI